MLLFKLLVRNLLSQRGRLIQTLGSVLVCTLAVLVFYGFKEFSYWGAGESYTNSGHGHIQVADARWFGHEDQEAYLFKAGDIEPLIAELASDSQLARRITALTRKRRFSGLATFQNQTSAFTFGYGIDAYEFEKMAPWQSIHRGQMIDDEDPTSLAVGGSLADAIGADIESTVTISAVTDEGIPNIMDFQLAGTYHVNTVALDEQFLVVPLATLMDFKNSDQIDSLHIGLHHTEDTSMVLARVKHLLRKHNLRHLVAHPWHEVSSEYQAVRGLYDSLFVIVSVVLGFVVFFSCTGTMSVVVNERLSEIAIMRVLGGSRPLIGTMVMVEMLVVGLLGVSAGAAFCHGLGQVLEFLGGIEMAPPPGYREGYQLFLKLPIDGVIRTCAGIWFGCWLACLLPLARVLSIPVDVGLEDGHVLA